MVDEYGIWAGQPIKLELVQIPLWSMNTVLRMDALPPVSGSDSSMVDEYIIF